MHLIASAANYNLSGVPGDFKKFTSNQIVSTIENNWQESRRKWMLDIFHQQGEKNSRNQCHQFWRQENCPQELYSPGFIFQKLNYIHNNPVEAGIVDRAEEYLYSSARDYYYTKKCGLLDLVFV